ncbi:MAG: STAS domain-containing protein [Acidimicrobiales bacterium]
MISSESLPFSVEVLTEGDQTRIVARGEIDIATEQALRDAAAAAVASAPSGRIVVDLHQVSFMDSSGLRALLQSRDTAEAAGTAFRITAVPEGAVQRLFRAAGVADWFDYE